IATGSEPSTLPGIAIDGKFVVSSTEALAFDQAPKNLLIVGAGYIGLEIGSVWARLGAKVTVLEFLPRILPACDRGIAALAQKSLANKGLDIHLETRVAAVENKNGQVLVKAKVKGEDATFSGDKVLMAVGRRPVIAGAGLEQAGVAVEAKSSRIKVDAEFRT